MATADSEDKPSEVHLNHNIQSLEETPWIAYTAQQAQLFQKNLTETIDSAFVTAKSRISEIRTTSSAHFNQTLDSLQVIKSEYVAYEDLVFGKLKEGVLVAASNPILTCGAALGLGILLSKKPRRYLTSKISHIFVSEEALLSKAHDKAMQLEESINVITSQTKALQNESLGGQEVFKRGKMKLRQSGKQIQGALSKAYKVEGEIRGLKDIVRELPSGQASEFRKTVNDLGKEAKQQRKDLNKEVSSIINLGIPI